MPRKSWSAAVTGALVVLALSIGWYVVAAPGDRHDDRPPTIWEYKAVGLKFDEGANPVYMQSLVAEALNSEAARGWEYVGRGARLDEAEYSVDYIVFRRKKF